MNLINKILGRSGIKNEKGQHLKKRNILGSMPKKKGMQLYKRTPEGGVSLVEVQKGDAYFVENKSQPHSAVEVSPDDTIVWASNMKSAIRKLYPEFRFKTKKQKAKARLYKQ
jgi:hypothetical protein